jgi:hypothetical protein
MKKFTIGDVSPNVVKVTHDADMFGVPRTDKEFGEFAILEARIDVEQLRNVLVEPADGEDSGDEIARAQNTRISLEPNPRTQNLKTSVAKEIKASLLERDGHFHRKNRGILLTADSFSYDNKTGTLTWIEDEPKVHGCLDGGHTLAIIDSVVGTPAWIKAGAEKNATAEATEDEKHKPVRPQFVSIQIVKGLPLDEIPEIAGARNTSVNVEDFALGELSGKFDFLKPVLEKAGLANLVAFKQNEMRSENMPKDVIGVLQCLTTLNNKEFDDDQKQPYHAYWSRSKTYDEFTKLIPQYKRLAGLTPDALALPEYIILKYRDWYQSTGGKSNTGRPAFGRTRECKTVDKFTKFVFLPIVRPGAPKEVKYQLQTEALAMPILAALRVIVSDDKEEAGWLTNPYDFLDSVGPTLVDSLTSAIQTMRGATTVVLKSKDVWKNLYVQAKTAAYELGILKIPTRK